MNTDPTRVRYHGSHTEHEGTEFMLIGACRCPRCCDLNRHRYRLCAEPGVFLFCVRPTSITYLPPAA